VGQLNGSGVRSVRQIDELVRVLEGDPEFRPGLSLLEVAPGRPHPVAKGRGALIGAGQAGEFGGAPITRRQPSRSTSTWLSSTCGAPGRSFRVPRFPLTPILGALMCAYLMASLGADPWVVFGIWMLVGVVAAYFGYGRRHSRVAALSHEEYRELSGRNPSAATSTPEPMKADTP
jgi:hypothetical protein